jgi:hypothetical protein
VDGRTGKKVGNSKGRRSASRQNDALVTIGAARYSVPVEYVGKTVSIQESATHYEILHGARVIARHQKAARHRVVMESAHYAGLFNEGSRPGLFVAGIALLGLCWSLTSAVVTARAGAERKDYED